MASQSSNLPGSEPPHALSLNRRLSTFQTIGVPLALMGPTASMAAGVALVAGFAGPAASLTYVIGFVAMAVVATSFAFFARTIATAGSVHGYIAATFGGRAGFVAAWLLLFGYATGAMGLAALAANFVCAFLGSVGLDTTSWWPVAAIVAILLALLLGARDITISSTAMLCFELVSMTALLALAVAIVSKAPVSIVPFTPGHGVGWSGIGYGVVFAITSYVGFESAATLGEEAERPLETIPKALIGTLVVGGLFFTVMSYVQVIGFGGSGQRLAGATAPLAMLGGSYIGPWYGLALDLAAAVGCFAGLSGCMVAASRMMLTVSRCGVLPALRSIDPVHRVPRRALLAIGLVATIGIVAMLGTNRALTATGRYFVVMTAAIILIYMAVTAAALVFAIRERRLATVAIGLAGLALMAWVLASTVYPVPAWPGNILPYIVFVWLVAGIAIKPKASNAGALR